MEFCKYLKIYIIQQINIYLLNICFLSPETKNAFHRNAKMNKIKYMR